MTTLGTMEDRIADELGRNDLNSQIRLEIKTAIKFYSSYRNWHNETRISTSLTTTSITAFYSLPSRFIGQIDTVRLTDSDSNHRQLNHRTYDWIDEVQTGASTSSGEPSDFCVYGNQLRLYPVPDGEYTITVSGVTEETSSLTSTACANWWTETAIPEALIRSRAKASVQINYLGDQAAKQEAGAMAMAGTVFLTMAERQYFLTLKKQTIGKISTGYVEAEQL